MNNYIEACINAAKLSKLLYRVVPREDIGITSAECVLLYLLHKQNKKDKSYQDLIHAVDGSYRNLTYNMQHLMLMGYIDKVQPDYADLRHTYYHITSKGEALCRKLDKFYEEIVEQMKVYMDWDQEELENFLKDLDNMSGFLNSRRQ